MNLISLLKTVRSSKRKNYGISNISLTVHFGILFFCTLTGAKSLFEVKYKHAGLEWSQFIDKSLSNGCTNIHNCTIEGEDGNAIDLINLKKSNVGFILSGEYSENHIIDNNDGRKPLHINYKNDRANWYRVHRPDSNAANECDKLDPGRSRLPSAQEVSDMQLSLAGGDKDYWGNPTDFWEKVDPGTALRTIWTSTIKAGREAQAVIFQTSGNGVFGGFESRHIPNKFYIGIRCVREIN